MLVYCWLVLYFLAQINANVVIGQSLKIRQVLLDVGNARCLLTTATVTYVFRHLRHLADCECDTPVTQTTNSVTVFCGQQYKC